MKRSRFDKEQISRILEGPEVGLTPARLSERHAADQRRASLAQIGQMIAEQQ